MKKKAPAMCRMKAKVIGTDSRMVFINMCRLGLEGKDLGKCQKCREFIPWLGYGGM